MLALACIVAPEQLELLMGVFENDRTPDLPTRQQLAAQLNLTNREVQVSCPTAANERWLNRGVYKGLVSGKRFTTYRPVSLEAHQYNAEQEVGSEAERTGSCRSSWSSKLTVHRFDGQTNEHIYDATGSSRVE